MKQTVVPDSIARLSETMMVIGVAVVILLTPALLNGYPFIFTDSGTYLRAAVDLRPVDDRPIFYSIFATLLHWRWSPWPIVVAQAFLVAYIIRIVAARLFDFARPVQFITTIIVLTAFTSLPWFVGQIMPDVFTAVLILAMLLLLVCPEKLSNVELWVLTVTVSASLAFHWGNLPILLLSVAVLVVMMMIGFRPDRRVLRSIILVTGAAAVALSCLVSANIAFRGRPVISTSSSTFLLAKFLEEGPALSVLEDECPGKYAICSQLPRLLSHKASGLEPTLADFFLWYGPVNDLGWIKSVEPEAADINGQVLRRYWPEVIRSSLIGSVRQLVHFDAGDGLKRAPHPGEPLTTLSPWTLEPSTLGPYAVQSIEHVFGKDSLSRFEMSIQGSGALDMSFVRPLHLLALALSVIALLWAIGRAWGTDRLPFWVAFFVISMVIGNAIAIGTLVPLHDRYQSRVVWLIPMVSFLALLKVTKERSVKAKLAPI
jgi:hypothetical protein